MLITWAGRPGILKEENRRQETGDRRQETEDRRRETEDRRQKAGDRRQKTGGAGAALLP
jgi:hypothetical protein